MLGQPQDSEPELDAYGLPVQYQPAKGRTVPETISWLLRIACPILGALSAGIAITAHYQHHKLAGHLTVLGAVSGALAMFLAGFGVPWWGKMGKKETGEAIVTIVMVGGLLGMIGLFTLTGVPSP